ncbi:hypothetical protein BWQ96_09234 [Gracilariopsis chorda]|uniref:Uncharacterized protein n=1 Tax=Gracilariopsis chorda TaxID=448386 RepID=A0A2V3IG39_9FLOR|nr:hypothetical protein BWQ96_09234 [Gracilariopsis chorda]|eukprot:PXF41055.1 hypothetical protein BWQ96_09234 [Gracilariopsis chorda]
MLLHRGSAPLGALDTYAGSLKSTIDYLLAVNGITVDPPTGLVQEVH